MFGKLRYWREGIVTVVAMLAVAATLLVFGDDARGMYPAVAVLYTIIVFGWSLVDRDSRLRSRHDDRSAWLILFVHIGFLAILLCFIFGAMRFKANLPHWIVAEDRKGSWFTGFLFAGGFILEAIEQHWLSARPRRNKLKAKVS
jgi:hypothetical protein